MMENVQDNLEPEEWDFVIAPLEAGKEVETNKLHPRGPKKIEASR